MSPTVCGRPVCFLLFLECFEVFIRIQSNILKEEIAKERRERITKDLACECHMHACTHILAQHVVIGQLFCSSPFTFSPILPSSVFLPILCSPLSPLPSPPLPPSPPLLSHPSLSGSVVKAALPIVCGLAIIVFVSLSVFAHYRYPHVAASGEKRHRKKKE